LIPSHRKIIARDVFSYSHSFRQWIALYYELVRAVYRFGYGPGGCGRDQWVRFGHIDRLLFMQIRVYLFLRLQRDWGFYRVGGGGGGGGSRIL
jgi:hypothetical protein